MQSAPFTLSEKLFRRTSGYSGNRVENKPHEIEIKYTMTEAQKLIDAWLELVYSETIHSSTGQRPREPLVP
ncbi:hypothetical protein ACFL9U_05125 [Thermodesulfobacteriota bacterium]